MFKYLLEIPRTHRKQGLKVFKDLVPKKSMAILVDDTEIEEHHDSKAAHLPLRVREQLRKLRTIVGEIE
jgi:hypothetical protein